MVDTESLNFLPYLPSGLLACNRLFLFGGLRALRLRNGFLLPLPLPQGQGLGGRAGGTVDFIPSGAVGMALDLRSGLSSRLGHKWPQDVAKSLYPWSRFPHLQSPHRLRLCDSVVFTDCPCYHGPGCLEDLKDIVSVSDLSIVNSN